MLEELIGQGRMLGGPDVNGALFYSAMSLNSTLALLTAGSVCGDVLEEGFTIDV